MYSLVESKHENEGEMNNGPEIQLICLLLFMGIVTNGTALCQLCRKKPKALISSQRLALGNLLACNWLLLLAAANKLWALASSYEQNFEVSCFS